MVANPTLVVLLAAFVAVTWGFSPILEKRGLSSGGAPIQAALVFVAVSTGLYWTVLLASDGGSVLEGVGLWSVAVFGVAGVVGTAVGRIFLFEGVGRVGASVSGACVSTRPVFSAALAWVWLGEGLGAFQLAGISVLVLGLSVVSLSEGGDTSGWTASDLLYPIVAASLFGAGFVLRRFGLLETGMSPLKAVAINETAALLALAAFVTVRDDPGTLRRRRMSYVYFLFGGTAVAAGLLAFFGALSLPEGRVAAVDPIAATAPLFTVGFSYVLLEGVERVTRMLVVGVALTVVGAAVVAL